MNPYSFSRHCVAALFAIAAVTPVTAMAELKIVSGDWASLCVEDYTNGSPSVACERFGGFLTNVFPEGCQGSSMFVCQGMTICDVARQVAIIDNDDYTKLQTEALECEGEVMGPASIN